MGGTGIPYGEMLRGYPDNMIGPLSISTYGSFQPGGGSVMMKYSIEFRLSLSESPTIFALAFADAGNVYDDFDNSDPFQLMRSAGFGIRLFMPMIGVLGYDMGYGFDNLPSENDAHGWEHHLIFGMPF
jgi:outer membrane protein insertion porin family